MVAFELHVDCEQFQYSMYAISAAYNWLFGCASTKAAGQFISPAVEEESELASLGLLGPSCTLGLAPSRRELQPPAEPLSPVNCYRSSLRRALLRETKQLPRAAYCWTLAKCLYPFCPFLPMTAATVRWGVLDVPALLLARQWGSGLPLLLAPVFLPFLVLLS